MKAKRNIFKSLLGICSLSLAGLVACTPMDHYYKDLAKQGDRVYVGKINETNVFAGRERIKISWKNPSDPSMNGVYVYWNNNRDSVFTANVQGLDTGFVHIDGLDEGTHVFNLVTTDAAGNRSLRTEVTGSVYGNRFQNTLRNRVLQSAQVLPAETTLSWFEEFNEAMVSTEFNYTTKAGASKTVFIPRTATEYTLSDVDPNKPVKHRSLFVPQSGAIDTFYTELVSVNLSDYQLREFRLTGTGASTADFINFADLIVHRLAGATESPETIDLAHLRGSTSGHNLNLITNGPGFSAFTAALRTNVEAWPVRNGGWLVNLGSDEQNQQLYDSLDEKNRAAMAAAFETVGNNNTKAVRLTQLAPQDVIFFNSEDRGLYVVIRVLEASSTGDLVIEFKLSKPN